MNKPCPCGSGHEFDDCCGAIIHGAIATTPEILMRSRYSAYVLGHWDYLKESWHSDTRPSRVSPTNTAWLGLTIIKAEDEKVEFIAGFNEQGKIMLLHEISRFAKEGIHWRYVDGECRVREAGRNERCPCNSGKKVKQCCLKQPSLQRAAYT